VVNKNLSKLLIGYVKIKYYKLPDCIPSAMFMYVSIIMPYDVGHIDDGICYITIIILYHHVVV